MGLLTNTTTVGRHFVAFRKGTTGYESGQSFRVLSDPPIGHWLREIARESKLPFPENTEEIRDVDPAQEAREEAEAHAAFNPPAPSYEWLDDDQIKKMTGWTQEKLHFVCSQPRLFNFPPAQELKDSSVLWGKGAEPIYRRRKDLIVAWRLAQETEIATRTGLVTGWRK